MNYCSNCGSNQLVFEIPEGDNRARYMCQQCNTIHYQNPKLVVGCLPVYEDKILICRRAIAPCYGLWNLPAGYLENEETVEEGAIRETWEEANTQVEVIKLHCIYNLPHINQVYLHFLAKLKNPYFSCGSESLEVKLFEEKDIPWNHLAFSSSKFALKKYIQFKENFPGVHIGTFNEL
ncbi:NUDIX hydrolase [Catalinimonas niigatensis]|uniref:NUDIX hydrolase n=1 Tax=Catalinimonas niigatensis TaxID=1397264 RepID=UPI0026653E68|nr:NUDIX hydrolase [Catalinimonas niigatensis]WPP52809.1 NUDIX hydrolase [Catalinimonas niigatensis]